MADPRSSPDTGAPVVVVGNGPVGQSAALLLARWGVRVVVVDQRAARDLIGSKAICQQRDVLDIWESVGAGEQIAAAGLTWSTVRTFYGEDELFSYDLDSGESHFPPFVNLSQTRSEQILDARVSVQPLIDVRWAHAVTSIRNEPDGVTVTCATPAGETVLDASYVVICSGARSDELRRQLGLTFEGYSFDDRFLICDIRADLPGWRNERRFHFDPSSNPGRQVLIHPCPDSTFRIDWQVPSDYDVQADLAAGGMDARIRAIIGDVAYEVVWSSVYRFHSRVVDRMRVGRVLLAGDAAHLVAPFGARGLNSGVADAENAAWKVAFVCHGWADASILDSYHDERHAAALENLAVTTATMNFLVPQSAQMWEQRREILDRARRDPAARAMVDSGRLSEPFWYPDSPLTTPRADRAIEGPASPVRPPPPAPGTLLPDWPITGRRGRLRAILRDGVLLLHGPGVDGARLLLRVRAGVAAPVDAVNLADIDPGGALSRVLCCGSRDVWVIRPDGYVAAALDDPCTADVLSAVERVLRCRRTEPIAAA